PDDLDLALNVAPDALAPALLVAAAVKLFELGKISAGEAAELAGVAQPPVFLSLAGGGGGARTALCAENRARRGACRGPSAVIHRRCSIAIRWGNSRYWPIFISR